MIYTITLNPAVDYQMEFSDPLHSKGVNLADHAYLHAGGKGINGSMLLSNLGIHSTVLSFLGGFTGSYIKEQIGFYSFIDNQSTKISEPNRINVKVKDGPEYVLNTKGPAIPEEAQQDLLSHLDHLKKEDYVMICGRAANGIDITFLYELADRVNEAGAKLIMDTADCRLEDLVYCSPFLIKPNLEELSELLKEEVTMQNCAAAVEKVLQKGTENVLLTMGAQGGYFDGKLGRFVLKSPEVPVISTNGAGDAALAAFIGTYQSSKNAEEALKMSMAAGTASVQTEDIPDYQSIMAAYNEVKISRI